jgi:dUTP pyrophosphatase
VLLANFGDAVVEIEPGMRIAQLVFCKPVQVDLEQASRIAPSKRGARGFGSTGGYPKTRSKIKP